MTENRVVVSFPKSGRTWLRYGAELAGLQPEFTHAGFGTSADNIGLPYRPIPEDLKTRPVIFIHRNPIDTAVSYFYQILHKDCVPGRKTWRFYRSLPDRPEIPVKINDFVTHPLFGVELVCRYNRDWLDHLSTRKDSVILSYEEMHVDPIASFRKFFEALGYPEIDAEHIAEQTTFDRMKALQASEEGPRYRLVQAFGNDPNSGKVRTGMVRGYRKELVSTTIRKAQQICAQYGFQGV